MTSAAMITAAQVTDAGIGAAEVTSAAASATPELTANRPAGAVSRVIVGVDDSGPGLAALAAATQLATAHDARLVAVRAWALGLPRHGGRRMRRLSHPHVVLSFSGEEQCAAARTLTRRALRAAAGGARAGLPMTIETPECDPALALVRLASQPGDVIVVGTHSGRRARRVIHGSVASYCARHASCPVVLVPAADRTARLKGTARAAGIPRSWWP